MKIAGIDGYKGGWIAVCVDGKDFAEASLGWAADLTSLVVDNRIDLALVDVPIGLTGGPKDRLVDGAARAFLKGKASSVFNAPCWQALNCENYSKACEVNRAVLGKGLSKQTFAIFPMIRAAEKAVDTLGQTRIREGHPEVSFAILNRDAPVQTKKKTLKGQMERMRLLAGIGFELFGMCDALPTDHPAKADDIFDAAVLAWSAARVADSTHQSFPDFVTTSSRGIEMAIRA